MADKNPVVESGELVRPSDIATALEKIRRTAEETDEQRERQAAGQAAPRVKTTLANLIILSANSPRGVQRTALDSLLTELCITHPSRFFLIEFCDGEISSAEEKQYYNGVRSFVSSRCVLAHSGSHVCSEEVHLSVKNEGVNLIPGLVRSLLVPDVEVALLVLDGGASPNSAENKKSASPVRDGRSELLDGLRATVNAVIYDSSLLGPLNLELPMLLGLEADSYYPGCSISLMETPKVKDLNYRRARRWRELIAEGFDNERLTAEDSVISDVLLTCTTLGTSEKSGSWRPSNDSLLIAGWISQCLGWKLAKDAVSSSANRVKVNMTTSGKTGTITFEPGSQKTNGLGAVEIFVHSKDTSGASQTRSLKIKRSDCGENAEVSFHDETTKKGQADQCDFFVRSVPFAQMGLRDLVMRGIQPQRGDDGFEDALSFDPYDDYAWSHLIDFITFDLVNPWYCDQFSPVFWEQDEGKIYSGIHDWHLPKSIKKDEKAWNITVCYPKDFSAVPMPPEAKSQCGCIRDNIPPVEPPK